MTPKILLLEDDANLAFVLQEHLESEGFTVTLKTNGEDGLSEAAKQRFDLCLVDVMMPKKDGFSFVKEFRKGDRETPAIFLTAKALKEDKVEGFTVGGDDYVTKPFSMEELMLRIRAVLRRSGTAQSKETGTVPLGRFLFDANRQVLVYHKRKKKLTATEAQVLGILYGKRNETVERGEILKAIWGDDSYFNGRSLDVFVSKLRKVLSADPAIEIKSVHGKGYRLVIGNQ